MLYFIQILNACNNKIFEKNQVRRFNAYTRKNIQ